jgi:hypothetical protein
MVSTALLINATAYRAAAAARSDATAACARYPTSEPARHWSRRRSLIFAVASSIGLWGAIVGAVAVLYPDFPS